MAFDLVVRNGTVVDGSGRPRFRADVGVVAGRIAEIGRIREMARETIDAEGMIVSPGSIDGHTHMDAQVSWDTEGAAPAGTNKRKFHIPAADRRGGVSRRWPETLRA